VELDRVVQVRVSKPDSPGRAEFASGYLVAPRLILTAAHVLGTGPQAGDGPVTVCRPDIGPERFAADVIWHRNDEMVDAALIEIGPATGWLPPVSLRDMRTRPPQRWGHLIGAHRYPATACGFPRMQKDQAGRLTEQLDGHVHPGTGRPAHRYEISSTDPTPAYARSPGTTATGWSGISGAALICADRDSGDLLIGVLRRDRQADGGTRLTATRARDLLADPSFRQLIVRHSGWDPLLEPAEPAHLLAPAAHTRDLRSPAALLRADAEVVDFHGRTRELRQLTDWCQSDRHAFAVQVLTGPGGQGKTRLARRLTAVLRQTGWVAAHLRGDLNDQSAGLGPDWSSLDTDLPLLLVVDYAETLPRQVRQLIEHLRHTRHQVRLLLLARADGGWKSDTLGAGPDTRELLADAPANELGPLLARTAKAEDRAAAYNRALISLARLLGQVPDLPGADWNSLAAALASPDDLADPRYDTALTLQMTALAALLQNGPSPVPEVPGRPVEAVLLGHEARYWHGTATSPIFHLASDLTEQGQRRAVATAAAFGAATEHEALATLQALPGLPPGRHWPIAEWLRALYPPAPGTYWGALQPDRLAEYHVATQFTGPDNRILSPVWAAASDAQQTQALTVLARAAIAHANAGRTTPHTQVLDTLDHTLSAAPPGTQVLEAASAALPHPSRTLAALGLRLTHALAASHRRLAETDPDAHEPRLAEALNNLSVRYGDVGRQAAGLAAGEEAGVLYRRLSETDPGTHEPGVASTLTNLSVRYGEMGRRGEALAAIDDAVVVYRRLAAANPEAHEPGLARALNNLSVRCGAMGRPVEGLAAIEEAVLVYRRLAAANLDAHEPDLARALTNLAHRYRDMERRPEGLATIEDAVAIRRRLAEANPDAHEPDLAGALNHLSAHYGEAGRREEGLAAIEEAIGVYRRLAEADPDSYDPALAEALNNLSIRYGDVGRPAEGLVANERSVVVYRRLVEANPDAHEPALAMALTNLSIRYSELGRSAEGLVTIEEAAGIYRRLAETNPGAYEPDLATALSNLAVDYAEAGRGLEGLAAIEAAVSIRRRLAEANPDAHLPALAMALTNLSKRYGEVGYGAESLKAIRDAVAVRRRLAEANPVVYEPTLAMALTTWALALAIQPNLSQALGATEEAVEIYRRHVATAPGVFQRLHTTLSLQAAVLDGLGRRQDAQEVRGWLAANPVPPDPAH
jgi:tetratricopeptide (TPR) repeat protein